MSLPELPASVRLLAEIDARQDEALRELEVLEQRIDQVISQCGQFCRAGGSCPNRASKPAGMVLGPTLSLSETASAAPVS